MPRSLHPRPAALAAALLLAGALAAPARAEWVDAGQDVPVDRIVANLERRVAARPEDADAHRALARIHSLAWARGGPTVRIVEPREGQETAPGFPPWESVQVQPQSTPAEAARWDHYRRSVLHYRRATVLAPEDPLAWLGLGWMLEVGARHPLAVGLPDGEAPTPPPTPEERRDWVALASQLLGESGPAAARALAAAFPRVRPLLLLEAAAAQGEGREAITNLLRQDLQRQAIVAYRKAFALDLERELAEGSLAAEGDDAISLEAGEGLLRLLEAVPDAAEEGEQARVKADVEKLDALPRWITPILFPLEGRRPLAACVRDAPVRFDLDGDGRPGWWPWVRPDVGLLVWDPEGRGTVDSGRRLFGSVTWWMLWRDGYEALAALDDDGDGRLAGCELEGIAVWVDADGDGVSDPGEVLPASRRGIVEVRVQATGREDGVLAHADGILLADGTTRPSYDWTPRRAAAPALGRAPEPISWASRKR